MIGDRDLYNNRCVIGEFDSTGDYFVQIEIEWQEPVRLTKSKQIIIDETDLPEMIEGRAGVYFFARKHGRRHLPFYVGETIDLRARLKNHLESRKLADVLRGMNSGDKEIKQGDRYFHYGYVITKQAQIAKKCIQIVQRHLVRQAIAQGLPLLNVKLTKYKTDALVFGGKKSWRAIYPKAANLEA